VLTKANRRDKTVFAEATMPF